ncbi:MAG: peptidase S9 [Acidobacteria bacterium RIFCSPLOWO2_02_FULL_67_36]|nr:MAG: peptidase S9 [Acidobacteria bacterium RIFCSPLOWO2_02_FULL_67_36]OFW18490.1 MAG: peptidase S9 [Acidobacteria bacterium RIFCSPLOWO2_12_FULL_66_21]
MKKLSLLLLCALAATPVFGQAKRPLAVSDLYSLREVRDPQRSPDGKWVAYAVARAIKDTDKNDADVWMVSWDGQQQIQVTSTPEGESSPRWSPDDKYLAFVSSRQGAKDGQIWLLNRAGGEAVKLTDVKGGVSDYAWSPDGKRFVMVVQERDPRDADDDKDNKEGTPPKTPKPIVVDRYYFKRDIAGYLRNEKTHLYLFDIEAKKAEVLTPGTFNEQSPAWSPDGRQIAFIRRHGEGDVDKAPNSDLFVIDARAGAEPKRLTTSIADEAGRLAWSPDGKSIAYVVGDEPKFSAYDQNKLAVIPAAGGEPRLLTVALDRPVRSPFWMPDGTVVFNVVDDRSETLARVAVAGGEVRKLITGRRVVSSASPGPDGSFAVLASIPTEVPEIHALENGTLRRLTHQNDTWIKDVLLGTTDEFASTSKDGTEVHGLITRPASRQPGERHATLLRIHGGPNGQDANAFNFERELFAANGYVVVAVNYRGSNGRGSAYQKAIFADWGNKEVVDLLGAMDYVQKLDYVDPNRLGIGGWSYGGILTNYTIATDGRFRAAVSGAGSSNQITMYGTDQYINQYELEIGPPWKAQDLWIKISYPFFHADRIRTPTLFMGGERDFNVPIIGGEQMYQALRSLGVDTQLVIYPNQFHGITVPSYKADRLERYVAWYDKYLKKPASPATTR